ncbi:efflux transporter periplasmic adaptor subunit [Cupriavidus pauculus]|uniref:Efflux transporter periplasmic adaptor subunit n=1 Tax=Cupriavidus pauculus TaxID=82633 RepID=A0A2N5C6P7_9BURK|nr:efflux RND transporter periplasmic adaptor subunit [Cupriavidus pauculus]PLP97905.1 efflux transporter periplasmic adaptor subunit [Cupriavidus pauculus]
MKILSFRRRHLVMGLAVCVLLLAVVLSLFLSPKPLPYTTARVERRDLELAVLAVGALQPVQQVKVGARVDGQVKALKVRLGDKVRKGQLLAEIDAVASRNELGQKIANEKDLVAQRKGIVANLAKDELALRRREALLAIDAASRQDFEAARALVDGERARLVSLEAKIEGAAAEVEIARARLGYTQIVAPTDGEVVAIVTPEGQTVIASQQAPEILRLADMDEMTVRAQVSEADVGRVRPGQTAYFTILGDPDTRHYGKIRAIEPVPQGFLEAPGPAGGTMGSQGSKPGTAVFYNVLFDVPNVDRRLQIAMTAQVSILIATARQVLSIPVAALGKRIARGRHQVRVLGRDDRVAEREVRTGLNNRVNVEVCDGLAEGERVVTGLIAPTTTIAS